MDCWNGHSRGGLSGFGFCCIVFMVDDGLGFGGHHGVVTELGCESGSRMGAYGSNAVLL